MNSGMTIETALDLLLKRYEMTKARHLLTIDAYDAEYQQLRDSIVKSFWDKGKQPRYVIVDSISVWDESKIIEKHEAQKKRKQEKK